MPQLRAFLLRLAGIFQRQAAEQELNEEIEGIMTALPSFEERVSVNPFLIVARGR
jgi:hypothetical protein